MGMVWLGLCLVLLVGGCGGEPADTVDVLFIGNSHTGSNDLPGIFKTFSGYGGHHVSVESVTPGGATLSDHAESEATIDLLRRGGWEHVVLQEQSVVPGVRTERSQAMLPAVRTLAREALVYDAEPLLFLTWGWDQNLQDVGFRDYAHMQTAVTDGYRRIADASGVSIAPVGEAWALARGAGTSLYQDDGFHPGVAGSYLAAAVLYATVFNEDPRLVEFDGGLPPLMAASLRKFAGEVAFDGRQDWMFAQG